MLISVIIPTLQAEKQLPALLIKLNQQTVPPSEIIVVDSSSTDNTLAIAQESKCLVISVARRDFRHGGTRNLGAREAKGDILLYLTQDAMPADQFFIERLVQPICEGKAYASSARQIAFPDANPIEKFSRMYNYPDQNSLRTDDDVKKLGVKTYFFSNSASAILRKAFWSVGGFSNKLIVNEDMYLCATLIHNNYSVAYQADALVYHSHNYRISQLFKRYFDIGVFFAQASNELHGVKSESEGFRFVSRGIRYLVLNQECSYIPRLIVESAVKYIAFRIGLNHQIIPLSIRVRISGQENFW